jgi:hypothetical protein
MEQAKKYKFCNNKYQQLLSEVVSVFFFGLLSSAFPWNFRCACFYLVPLAACP